MKDSLEVSTEVDTFWDPEFYKKSTKRIEDGFKLCGEFVAMLEERADIEKNYSKNLQGWSRKWQDVVVKGPEHGAMEQGLLALMDEANSLGQMHQSMRQGLEEYVIENIKLWVKDGYHKGLVTIKEKKDMDDLFKKVQKPWANQLTKVKKAKSLYYDSCRNERKALKFKENVSLALSEEQLKKIDERIQKTKEETVRCKESYTTSIEELNMLAPKYVEDMKLTFQKCQFKESQRLNFFKETLIKIHSNINVSQNALLSKIYEKYYKSIDEVDHKRDMVWWASNFGDKMIFSPPQFEEFSEQTDSIKRGNSLLRTVMRKDSMYKSTTLPKLTSSSTTATTSAMPSMVRSCSESVLKTRSIKVRALYDYHSNAFDELSLKEGEEFDKLEDEDELGWSKGLKDGKLGLYPANYVEVVASK